MKNKPKAILFDLDNTLVDTHRILNKYLVDITKKYYKITPKEEHILETETMEQVMNWMKLHGVKIKPWTAFATLIHFVFTDITKIKTFPGIEKLLQEYNEKVPLAIITNSPNIYAKKVLRLNKLTKYFSTIQTTTRNKPKPNTAMIYRAAKKLKLNTADCIVVDDGKAGINAGKEAGCTTIYFSKDKDAKADYYAKNATELNSILKKLF